MSNEMMWYEQRIEPFIDGQLPPNEARLFSAKLKLDRQLRAGVAAATQLRQQLRDMAELKCPRRVTRRIFEATGNGWHRSSQWLSAALAAAAGLGAIAIVWWHSINRVPSAAELIQARAQLQIALAYLDHAGTVASAEIGNRWIEQGLLRPMNQGLGVLPGTAALKARAPEET